MNADYKDASKSPLKDKDRKTFRTLDFFMFDSTYVVTALLKRTPDSKWFKMKLLQIAFQKNVYLVSCLF